MFKYESKIHPNYAKFTTLLSKDYPYFSNIYRINSKTQIRLKPKSSKIAHFPIKNYYNLQFTTTPQNHFFPTIHTLILLPSFVQSSISLKFSRVRSQTIVQLLSKTPPNMLQHYLQNILDILKFQLQKNPKFYQVNDINTLIHNVTHT